MIKIIEETIRTVRVDIVSRDETWRNVIDHDVEIVGLIYSLASNSIYRLSWHANAYECVYVLY